MFTNIYYWYILSLLGTVSGNYVRECPFLTILATFIDNVFILFYIIFYIFRNIKVLSCPLTLFWRKKCLKFFYWQVLLIILLTGTLNHFKEKTNLKFLINRRRYWNFLSEEKTSQTFLLLSLILGATWSFTETFIFIHLGIF